MSKFRKPLVTLAQNLVKNAEAILPEAQAIKESPTHLMPPPAYQTQKQSHSFKPAAQKTDTRSFSNVVKTALLEPEEDPLLTLVTTSHPVTHHEELHDTTAHGIISKPLWHEIRVHANATEEAIKNYRGKNVQFRFWNYSDCDRHPDQQAGIITYGSTAYKLAILKGLNVPIDENLEKRINEYLDKQAADFDLAKNDKDYKRNYDYKVGLKEFENDFRQLNDLWKAHEAEINNSCDGSDYRISSKDLKDQAAREVIKKTLLEIYESESDVKRLIIADFNGEEDIAAVKELEAEAIKEFMDSTAKGAGEVSEVKTPQSLQTVLLFEDRAKPGLISQLIGKYPELEIQLAGSDTKRRIGEVGLLKLLLESQKSGISKIFIGSGNTHWRTEDLMSLVMEEVEPSRTVQGTLGLGLQDPTFAENFMQEQKKNLKSRPSAAKADEVFDLFVELDKFQETESQKTKDQPIFKKDRVSLILNNAKFFGARHKPNKFPADDGLSESHLLEMTRAIEHAWIYQLTGAVSPEIIDLHGIIQNESFRESLLANKENPYVLAVVKSAAKGLHYCDETVAEKFCANNSLRAENFAKAQELGEFINEHYPQFRDKADLMRQDLKRFGESDQDFSAGWNQFTEYRRELADLVTKENVSGQEVNKSVSGFYSKKNVFEFTGRNFSTQRDIPSNEDAISRCLCNISDCLTNSPQAEERSEPRGVFGLKGNSALNVLKGITVNSETKVSGRSFDL